MQSWRSSSGGTPERSFHKLERIKVLCAQETARAGHRALIAQENSRITWRQDMVPGRDECLSFSLFPACVPGTPLVRRWNPCCCLHSIAPAHEIGERMWLLLSPARNDSPPKISTAPVPIVTTSTLHCGNNGWISAISVSSSPHSPDKMITLLVSAFLDGIPARVQHLFADEHKINSLQTTRFVRSIKCRRAL